jgi:hypothetical protein
MFIQYILSDDYYTCLILKQTSSKAAITKAMPGAGCGWDCIQCQQQLAQLSACGSLDSCVLEKYLWI